MSWAHATGALLIAIITGALLLLWALTFSRLPWRTRGVILAAAVLLIGGFRLLFRLDGFDGNVVPNFVWRWSGERDFGATTQASGVTNPGPDDYPQFYGPRRDARLDGLRLARDWQAKPPREVWRHDVGEGWSSFAIVGNAAVTHELRGDDEVVVRYELETGNQVWIHSDPEPLRTSLGGNGPRTTPAIADGRVYSYGGTGLLNSLDLETGERAWSHNVLDEHGGKIPEWGVSSSPLVAGDLVVVQPGWGPVSLAAYDRTSGELAWTAGKDRGSYSSPVLVDLGGREQILIVNASSFSGYDPATGEELWRETWKIPGERISMPLVVGGDRLLVSAGYGVGSRLFRVGPAGLEELWESRRLKSKYAPIFYHRNTIFGLDDGILVAIDPATGERRWKRGRYGHGQMILAGEDLLVLTEKGDVVLVEASPEEHRELARLPALSDKTWNPPAISGRYLLVRNHHEAVCYELPLESSS